MTCSTDPHEVSVARNKLAASYFIVEFSKNRNVHQNIGIILRFLGNSGKIIHRSLDSCFRYIKLVFSSTSMLNRLAMFIIGSVHSGLFQLRGSCPCDLVHAKRVVTCSLTGNY